MLLSTEGTANRMNWQQSMLGLCRRTVVDAKSRNVKMTSWSLGCRVNDNIYLCAWGSLYTLYRFAVRNLLVSVSLTAPSAEKSPQLMDGTAL